MKCSKCGFDNTDNATICENCGCALGADTKATDKNIKKIFSAFKKGSGENLAAVIVPICAVLLLTVTLFLIIRSFVETSEDVEVEDYYVTFYDVEKDVTYFLYKGKQVSGYIRGKCDDPYDGASMSIDGSVLAVVSEMNGKNGGYALSVVTPSEVKMISDRVSAGECNIHVSMDGDFVAYTLNKPGALYVYDVGTGKSEIAVSGSISDLYFVQNCEKIVCVTSDSALLLLDISTGKEELLSESVYTHASLDDGARIAYITSERDLCLYTDWSNSTDKIAEDVLAVYVSDEKSTFAFTARLRDGENVDPTRTESFFYSGQKQVKIGEDIKIVALDDKGQRIYFEDKSGSLFLTKQSEESAAVFEGKKEYYLCEDLSEVFYTDDSGIYIFSADKNQTEKISEPSDTFGALEKHGKAPKKFTDRFYTSEDENGLLSLLYVTEDIEAVSVDEGVKKVLLSDSGEKVFFEKDGVVLFSEKKKDALPKKVCSGTLSDGLFYIAEDKNALYLLEENDDGVSFSLYWCKDGEKTLISENTVSGVYLSHDGYLFFAENVMTDENGVAKPVDGKDGYPFYCIKDGEEKNHIADNITEFRFSKASAYIVAPSVKNETGEDESGLSVYGCVKGSKFKIVIEEISYDSSLT